jgi:hypothetical protein
MEAILHILGLCPDHLNHFSLIDAYLNLQQTTVKGLLYHAKDMFQKVRNMSNIKIF